MVYVVPVTKEDLKQEFGRDQKATMGLLRDLKKFRNSMKETSDSVPLLREIRGRGR